MIEATEAVIAKFVCMAVAAMGGAFIGATTGLVLSWFGMKTGVLLLPLEEDGHLDWDLPFALWGAITGSGIGGLAGWRFQPGFDDLRAS